MRIFSLFAALLLSGCAGSFEEARVAGQGIRLGTPSECQAYDDGHRNWSAVEKAAGLLAGGSGLASIPLGDKEDLRIGLAAGAVGAASVSVFAAVQADGFAKDWARECSK